MAKQYIAEIRTCRPQGPYVILGACTGGLVAYEMAQQLVEQEEPVTLVMMNSWHPTSYRHYLDKVPISLALPLFIFWMTMNTVQTLRRMPMKDWLPFVQRRCEKFSSFLRRRSTENELIELQIERMEQAMFHAVARYTVRKYPGRILNIVASKRGVRDSRYVWTELAGGGCQTLDVAAVRTGDLLVSPHVEDISSHVQRFLAVGSQDKIVQSQTHDVVA